MTSSYIYRCDSFGGASYEVYEGRYCNGSRTSITSYHSYDISYNCSIIKSWSVEAVSRVECGTASFEYAGITENNMSDTYGIYHVMIYVVLIGLYHCI